MEVTDVSTNIALLQWKVQNDVDMRKVCLQSKGFDSTSFKRLNFYFEVTFSSITATRLIVSKCLQTNIKYTGNHQCPPPSDTPMLSISKSHFALFLSYFIHNIFRKLDLLPWPWGQGRWDLNLSETFERIFYSERIFCSGKKIQETVAIC